jgi:hypothetical protein
MTEGVWMAMTETFVKALAGQEEKRVVAATGKENRGRMATGLLETNEKDAALTWQKSLRRKLIGASIVQGVKIVNKTPVLIISLNYNKLPIFRLRYVDAYGIIGNVVPVAQWIEQWPPEPCAQVRFLSGTLNLDTSFISPRCIMVSDRLRPGD